MSQHELPLMCALVHWQGVRTSFFFLPLCIFSHLFIWAAHTDIHMPTLVWLMLNQKLDSFWFVKRLELDVLIWADSSRMLCFCYLEFVIAVCT